MFKRHICFVVEDFDKAAKTLEERGIKLEGVRETSVGWKIGYFYDPEGNQLELQMRPKGTPQT